MRADNAWKDALADTTYVVQGRMAYVQRDPCSLHHPAQQSESYLPTVSIKQAAKAFAVRH